jgi:hypothetical protein
MRRWQADTSHRIANAPDFRVKRGDKDGGDLRLDWWSSAQKLWVPVQMSAAALITDFFYENEEHLYPRVRGYMGGDFFIEYLKLAAHEGWQVADKKLRTEQYYKRTDLRG